MWPGMIAGPVSRLSGFKLREGQVFCCCCFFVVFFKRLKPSCWQNSVFRRNSILLCFIFICIQMLIVPLLIIAPTWKPSKFLAIVDLVSRLRSIRATEYCTTIKRWKLLVREASKYFKNNYRECKKIKGVPILFRFPTN